MAAECSAFGDTRYVLAMSDFPAYLRRIADGRREVQPDGRVPGTVRITCDEDNVGSIKIIEQNGGVLSGRGVSNESGKTVRQYWIELN